MARDDTYYGGTDAPLSIPQLRGGQSNVTGGEKWLSILAGGSLTAVGARRGGVVGTLATLAGVALLSRGIAGQDPVKRAFTPSPIERKLAQKYGWSTAATGGAKVTIGKPASEIFAFLHDLSNFPKFMQNLASVEQIGGKRSRWTVNGEGGKTFSYVSHITDEVHDKSFAWASEPGAEFKTVGEVTLAPAPGGRGTEVGITIAYEPRYGQLGRIASKITRHEPAIDSRKNMKQLKMLLETGEISTGKINARADNAA